MSFNSGKFIVLQDLIYHLARQNKSSNTSPILSPYLNPLPIVFQDFSNTSNFISGKWRGPSEWDDIDRRSEQSNINRTSIPTPPSRSLCSTSRERESSSKRGEISSKLPKVLSTEDLEVVHLNSNKESGNSKKSTAPQNKEDSSLSPICTSTPRDRRPSVFECIQKGFKSMEKTILENKEELVSMIMELKNNPALVRKKTGKMVVRGIVVDTLSILKAGDAKTM